ncbi:MAG: flagellar biosynthesis protein FliR [Pirellulaceae bacterium]|nr:MAG: flagellar biosynthesis protein FliR [Pirellulaceae bacterium]
MAAMNEALVHLLAQPLWVFISVLSRLSPVLMLAPPTRSLAIPMRIRALVALAAAALLTPVVMSQAMPMPTDMIHLVLAVAKEALLGLLLGTVVMMAIMGMQIAGQIASHLAGFDMATAADPGSSDDIPVISNLLGWLAMILLLILGGHRQLLECCLESFARYPVGMVTLHEDWWREAVHVLQHAFEVGIRAAAPMGIALLLANLVTGLLARTLPQLNVLAVGFNINALALLTLLLITMGGISYVFQYELSSWIASCHRIVATDP